jgi:hypothetical protein
MKRLRTQPVEGTAKGMAMAISVDSRQTVDGSTESHQREALWQATYAAIQRGEHNPFAKVSERSIKWNGWPDWDFGRGH